MTLSINAEKEVGNALGKKQLETLQMLLNSEYKIHSISVTVQKDEPSCTQLYKVEYNGVIEHITTSWNK